MWVALVQQTCPVRSASCMLGVQMWCREARELQHKRDTLASLHPGVVGGWVC
jgi:hypothetical protein